MPFISAFQWYFRVCEDSLVHLYNLPPWTKGMGKSSFLFAAFIGKFFSFYLEESNSNVVFIVLIRLKPATSTHVIVSGERKAFFGFLSAPVIICQRMSASKASFVSSDSTGAILFLTFQSPSSRTPNFSFHGYVQSSAVISTPFRPFGEKIVQKLD